LAQTFSLHVPTKVEFGDDVSAQVAEVLSPNARQVAVLRGGRGIAAEPVIDRLKRAGILVHQIACAGEPSVVSINRAVVALADHDIDAVVACGGGSVIDSGKAVTFCLAHGIRLTDRFSDVPAALLAAPCPVPLIAIPTTAGTGAEVTANAVLDVPSLQSKVSLRGRGLYPAHALVDPLLLPSAPSHTVLFSGLDAVVQTIEAFTSNAATPFSDALVEANITRGLKALRAVLDTGDLDAWREMAWVSLTSGLALANGGLGAAHGAAAVLGGRYGAAHGALCGRLLAPVLRQNIKVIKSGSKAHQRLQACVTSIARVFEPLPDQDALSGFERWIDSMGLPTLAKMGIDEQSIPELAQQSSQASSSKRNAVPLGSKDFEVILRSSL